VFQFSKKYYFCKEFFKNKNFKTDMAATYSENFSCKEIVYLVNQVGKINKLIEGSQNNKDKIGIWQYIHHRQQFIDQLNELLNAYNLKISTAV
jgi:hypothetical protein